MRPKILTWLRIVGLVTAAATIATPAMAEDGWFGNAPPSFAYQNPDGSYPSYTEFSRALWGMPCGIECTRRAEARWGMIPAPAYRRHYYYHYHRY